MTSDVKSMKTTRQPRVVIVGAGQAAVAAVRALRAEGHAGEIIVLGAERFAPYERPPLSKGLLLGTKRPEDALLLDEERLRELHVDLRLGIAVTRIDRACKEVTLENGVTLAYDRLVIATGGRPRQLELAGDASGEIAYLRTIDDALSLRERLQRARRLLVIGGGWIGLETACAARQMGLDVTLVEAGARLCERAVPAVISELLRERQHENGVDVRLGTQVGRLSKTSGEQVMATLGDVVEPFDLVVAGIGMIANDELAADAGLPCASGVLCDEAGRTSDVAVFACGDVAAFVHPHGPAYPRRLESWENAEHQGAACARALLGKDPGDAVMPWFWSEQGNTNLQILGFPDDARAPVTRQQDGKTMLFWLEAGRIVAAICVDAPGEMLIIRRLWQKRVQLDPQQLAAPDVNLKGLLQGVP